MVGRTWKKPAVDEDAVKGWEAIILRQITSYGCRSVGVFQMDVHPGSWDDKGCSDSKHKRTSKAMMAAQEVLCIMKLACSHDSRSAVIPRFNPAKR
jgi:hypothetical protein